MISGSKNTKQYRTSDCTTISFTTRQVRANAGRPLLSLVLVALVALCLPVANAYSQMQVMNGCMEAVYQAYKRGGGSLNCTANDVRVASVTNITILDDGCQFVGRFRSNSAVGF